jgi:acetyl-CoA C-acetyltransferase
VIGCVTQAKRAGGVRRAQRRARGGLAAQSVTGVTLNRFCGSGARGRQPRAPWALVAAGYSDLVVAGGVESMSRVPMGSDGECARRPTTSRSARSVGRWCRRASRPTSSPRCAASPAPTSTQFALRSQHRAALAPSKEGRFDEEPLHRHRRPRGKVILDRDEHPRAETTIEASPSSSPRSPMMGAPRSAMNGETLDEIALKAWPQVEAIQHIHHRRQLLGHRRRRGRHPHRVERGRRPRAA